ncbi:MAG: hypothetical protein DMG17_03265 [Acidobacteria bacterium]|nr:MAG: hypothetical protein AUH28_08225 [Acidobacteria bacterium 13_1_40CM_56_16]PYS19280.1 MAG: hypothetical protein DMG17_03265 [Acidobacteriota bacterium]
MTRFVKNIGMLLRLFRNVWTKLQAVGKRLGREMVLNTSFNVKGQPIVNTPAEALETFLRTGMDCLFLENVLVTRKR